MTTLELGKQRAKELGLKAQQVFRYYNGPGTGTDLTEFYETGDIHKLLGEAQIVFNSEHDSWHEFGWRPEAAPGCDKAVPADTHQALLIGIRPIVQESREQKMAAVLSEWLNLNTIVGWEACMSKHSELQARAKALLSEGK